MIETTINKQEPSFDHSFGKAYKLCSRKKIGELFTSGKVSKSYPLKAIWIIDALDDQANRSIQVAFSVPKKSFKHAHDRNRIKRLMREAFRLNKFELERTMKMLNHQVSVFILYQERVELSYPVIEKKMNKLIEQLINTLKNEIH